MILAGLAGWLVDGLVAVERLVEREGDWSMIVRVGITIHTDAMYVNTCNVLVNVWRKTLSYECNVGL